MTAGMVFKALDGSNPLAFLAALGAMRLLHREQRSAALTMQWVRDGVWRPEVFGISDSQDFLCERLQSAAQRRLPIEAFSHLGKNITVNRETFAKFAQTAYESIANGDRLTADFAAAFGSEVCEQEGKDRIEYTDLCFITGSGHQHFIGTMEGLAGSVTPDQIREALFGPWKPSKSFSMRWDPSDAAEYAFRWGDPSAEGASSVWGANLLAVHALPLFPTQPTRHGLRTTGFRQGGRGQWPEFTWPMWTQPIGLDTVRSLLSLKKLQETGAEIDHRALKALGIGEVYRAPRVRIGQGANFKVSFRPARSI